MDELAATNRARWNALVAAQVDYTRPRLDLTPETARIFLDPAGQMGDVTGKRVLCLAAGGGQQSVAFGLLGADVTVLDLSDQQLARDQEAAAHYGLTAALHQGDMRHLGIFPAHHFDLVYHAYSINFVPDVRPVIAEIARVLRPHGQYRVEWANPFTQTIDSEQDWTGAGYLLRYAYVDGRELTELYPTWTHAREDGTVEVLEGPREFVHALSTMINTLAAHALVITHCREETGNAPDAAPGTWPHYMQVAPPYITLWARYLPDLLTQ